MYEDMEDRIYQHHRLRVLRKRKEYEKYGLVPNYEELRTDPSYSDLRQRVEKARVIIQGHCVIQVMLEVIYFVLCDFRLKVS